MELIHSSIGKKLYRDGDKLVKSFDESYSKAGILNEALNQARVEETSLNIPKVLGVSVIDGKWSLVWEYIEGETLESLMKKHPAKEGKVKTCRRTAVDRIIILFAKRPAHHAGAAHAEQVIDGIKRQKHRGRKRYGGILYRAV